MKEILHPATEQEWLQLRTKDITSTEVGALFGISPYLTNFELFHLKKSGEVPEFKENERMKWGKRLQDSIAAGIAEEKGWTIRRMDEYVRDSELRIGASFDFQVSFAQRETKEMVVGTPFAPDITHQIGLLEIKNVDAMIFKKFWNEDGDSFEAPLHIEIQVQHQLAVSEMPFAYIGVLVGGNTVHLIRRERDEKVITAIRDKVKEFWSSIADDREPEVDFSKDSTFISKLYGFSEPNKYVDLSADSRLNELAGLYATATEAENAAKKTKERIKGEILRVIQDAEKVEGAGFKISAGMVPPTPVPAHLRKGYRRFQITWGKGE